MKFLPILSIGNDSINKPIVAIFGGGGKTSLLYTLGKEFSTLYTKVLLSSNVKAGPSTEFPIVLTKSGENIRHHFKNNNPLYVLNEKIEPHKYRGFKSKELLPFIYQADASVIECDGSRNLPLKAHSHGDPMVPEYATHVIIVIGADVINTTLQDGKVHRPELFKETWGIHNDTPIDNSIITKAVTTKHGYLSKMPSIFNPIYFINKADIHLKETIKLASAIAIKSNDPVYVGSLHESWWKKIN